MRTILTADTLTPILAYLRIQGKHKVILESIPREKENARFSIVAYNPVFDISFDEGKLTQNGKEIAADPLDYLNHLTVKNSESDLPFAGGAIGFVGYDMIGLYEAIGDIPKDTIYMGEEDVKRQVLNVFRMELLGAKVFSVTDGSRVLKDAVNAALRAWVENIEDTHYVMGSALGPAPFPEMVRDFQSVIGKEAKRQYAELSGGQLPDAVLACVGGGSNAIGLFYPFVEDESVALYGAEAAGHGLDTEKHAATFAKGRPGILHGALMTVLQDRHGQIMEAFSISAGLDYPGVGPEHCHFKDIGRASYDAITDEEALEAFMHLSHLEGIIPALESSHAIALTKKVAKQLGPDKSIIVCLSGRGDKDVMQVKERLETERK